MSPHPRLAPDEEIDGTFSRGPARRPAAPPTPPATPEEAEARFWRRYGWPLLEAVLGQTPRPITVQQWTGLAKETRAVLAWSSRERLARQLDDLAAALRREGA